MDNMAELNNNQVENAAHVIAKQLCFWHSCAVSLTHTVTLYGSRLQFADQCILQTQFFNVQS